VSGLSRFLGKLVARLDSAGVPHMLTGSVASTYFGEPRQTRDVDVVVDPSPDSLDRFVSSWANDGYADAAAAREALTERGMFNVVDFETGWKADLIVRKDRAFSLSEFGRRRRVLVLEIETWLATPEDIVLAKLEWARDSGSTRQRDDAAAVIRVGAGDLDWEYLRHWAEVLEIQDLLSGASKRKATE